MIYLYPNGNTFSIIYDKKTIPEKYHSEIIELETLPDGQGILKRDSQGAFYYEPFPEYVPEPEPERELTLEEKVDILKEQVSTENLVTFEVLASMYEESSTNNVTSFEVMATMYEEILELQAKVDQLNGGITP